MTLSKDDKFLSIERELLSLFINILSIGGCKYWDGALARRLENSSIFQSTKRLETVTRSTQEGLLHERFRQLNENEAFDDRRQGCPATL